MKHIMKTFEQFNHKTGIYIIPKTSSDAYLMGKVLDDSEYYTEWNEIEGWYFLEEEYEESFDKIMNDLEDLFDKHGLLYYFDTETSI